MLARLLVCLAWLTASGVAWADVSGISLGDGTFVATNPVTGIVRSAVPIERGPDRDGTIEVTLVGWQSVEEAALREGDRAEMTNAEGQFAQIELTFDPADLLEAEEKRISILAKGSFTSDGETYPLSISFVSEPLGDGETILFPTYAFSLPAVAVGGEEGGVAALLQLVLLYPTPPPDPMGLVGDATRGEALASRKCAACHSLDERLNKIGPHLFGLLGRPVASVEDYGYSDALRTWGEGRAWDRETLAAYMADPRRVVKGTSMGFAGLEPQEIADYLASVAAKD